MLRFKLHLENPHTRYIQKAVDILESGGIIVYPTDTVYGIGCTLYDKKALERLYRIKGKSKFDPVSLLVKDIKQASIFARINNFSYRILKHCLPGPFTFILPATREIPKIMLTKRKEIGIRIPDNLACINIIETLDKPLVNTSVNMGAIDLLNDPDDIENRYANQVDLLLDAGRLTDAMESTVISLVRDGVDILRDGKGDISKLFD